MFKLIKKWLDDYREINAYMAEQGMTTIHTPFGAFIYIDERVIEKLYPKKENDR